MANKSLSRAESVKGKAARAEPEIEDLCGDFGIRIARDGTWYYHNSPIGRKSLCKLFSTILRKDDTGQYWLVTPVEKGRIEVEDVPFIAVELTVDGEGPNQVLTLRTNLDHIVAVDKAHHIWVSHNPVTQEPSPYVLVRDNLAARINRPVYYHLIDLGVERVTDGRREFGVWSNNCFFALGELKD